MTPEMFQNRYVVRIIRIDDKTTGGKEGYIDNYGKIWVKSKYTENSAPTGQMIAKMVNGQIYN